MRHADHRHAWYCNTPATGTNLAWRCPGIMTGLRAGVDGAKPRRDGPPLVWAVDHPGGVDLSHSRQFQPFAPGRAGGSPNTGGTRRCCPREPHGCKAPRGSPRSCFAWPGSWKTGSPPRSSTAQTSGGPSRPGFAPSTPARRSHRTRHDPAMNSSVAAVISTGVGSGSPAVMGTACHGQGTGHGSRTSPR